tara:strand:+ start:6291 stop:7265 length:975 start_codon:yes stop_codon:yes gene_type:complete
MEDDKKENQQPYIETSSYKEIEWKPEHEQILVEWADKAMCYRWLHSKSHLKYKKVNAWFTIPVIIMSTITGTANFAQDRFPLEYKALAQMSIGAVNIFAGILTTIQQFLKISELNESHRVSSIAWDKFYRNIKVELAKSPEERIVVGQMLKMCKEEFDRLMETSPTISEQIIEVFKQTFTNTPKSLTFTQQIAKHCGCMGEKAKQENEEVKALNKKKVDNFLKICKPEICDELISTDSFRFDPAVSRTMDDIKGPSLQEIEMRRIKILQNYDNQITAFITSFESIHARKPLRNEIIDNLKDSIKLDILTDLLTKHTEIGDDNKI